MHLQSGLHPEHHWGAYSTLLDPVDCVEGVCYLSELPWETLLSCSQHLALNFGPLDISSAVCIPKTLLLWSTLLSYQWFLRSSCNVHESLLHPCYTLRQVAENLQQQKAALLHCNCILYFCHIEDWINIVYVWRSCLYVQLLDAFRS